MQPPPSVPGSSCITVAVVEDDHAILEAVCRAIQGDPGLRLLATAGSVAEGLALLDGAAADVLLVDLGLPDGCGSEIIRAASGRWPGCNIMVSSKFGDETHVLRAIEAGASGYLLKDSSAATITDEIRLLAAGGSPISPIIARQILQRMRATAATAPAPGGPSPQVPAAPTLSPREREVLELITKGFTMVEIARLLELSPYTVRAFVRRIYGKLEVNSKAEAIYEARALGLLGG